MSANSEAPPTDQRERILKAVTKLVATQGYTDTTIAHIVARAGVSTRTFYEHFSDKQDAFLAAIQIAASDALTPMQTAFQSQGTWPDNVYAGLEALLDLLVLNPALARMILIEIQSAGPGAIAEFQRTLRQFTHVLIPKPSDAPEPLVTRHGLSDQITGAILQLIYDKISDGQLKQLPDLLPELVEIALTPYLGPRRTAALLASREIPQAPTPLS